MGIISNNYMLIIMHNTLHTHHDRIDLFSHDTHTHICY